MCSENIPASDPSTSVVRLSATLDTRRSAELDSLDAPISTRSSGETYSKASVTPSDATMIDSVNYRITAVPRLPAPVQ